MRVLISGGGTGGHIFPALAVAQKLTELDPGGEVLYMGRRGGMEERLAAAAGVESTNIAMRGVQDEWWRNLPLSVMLPRAVLSARGAIRRFKADVVLGTGGYVSAAAGAAAILARRPLLLQEQNAYPGRATRMLAGRARCVALGFDESREWLRGATTVVTGTPVRADFTKSVRERTALKKLLVFGGSQGAHRINQAVEEGLKSLLELPGVDVTHVSGSLDHPQLHAFRGGLPEDLRERYRLLEFHDNFAELLDAADLAIARAGASGIAEMTAMGVPMILVPYPFAGGHQRFNAEPVARHGAATVIPDAELSGVRLLAEVQRFATGDRLTRMAKASRALGRPDAAAAVARVVLDAA